MKKVIVSAFILAALTTVSYAKNAYAAELIITTDDGKVAVDVQKLPDPVKATLAGDAYKGWQASNAWTTAAEPDIYNVELKKDDKTQVVKVDKNGKVK